MPSAEQAAVQGYAVQIHLNLHYIIRYITNKVCNVSDKYHIDNGPRTNAGSCLKKIQLTRMIALTSNCHVPKLHPINPLIPRFIALNGSTPNCESRKKDTHNPINNIPSTIPPVLFVFVMNLIFPPELFLPFSIYILDSKSVQGVTSPWHFTSCHIGCDQSIIHQFVSVIFCMIPYIFINHIRVQSL